VWRKVLAPNQYERKTFFMCNLFIINRIMNIRVLAPKANNDKYIE